MSVLGLPLATTRGAVVFTWDDGYASHVAVADLAQQRGQQHTFFINSQLLNTANHLTTAQVAALATAGHEIGSHGRTHVDVTTLSPSQRRAQWDGSKADLEAIVGAGKVTSYAYPYGNRNAATDQGLYLTYDRIRSISFNAAPGKPGPLLPTLGGQDGRSPLLIGGINWDGTARVQANLREWIRRAAIQPFTVLVYSHDLDKPSSPTTAQVIELLNLCQALDLPAVTLRDACPGGSLLSDPGFEDPALPAWWLITNSSSGLLESVADAPVAGLPGSRSAHLRNLDAATYCYASQQAICLPGVDYTLAGRYRVVGLSGVGSITLRVRQFDATGTVVATRATTALTATSWALGTVRFVSDARARWCLVDLVMDRVAGEVWFDHLDFRPTGDGSFA